MHNIGFQGETTRILGGEDTTTACGIDAKVRGQGNRKERRSFEHVEAGEFCFLQADDDGGGGGGGGYRLSRTDVHLL